VAVESCRPIIDDPPRPRAGDAARFPVLVNAD